MSGKVIDIFHPYAGSKTVTVRFDKNNEKTFTEGCIDYINYKESGFGEIDYVVTKNGILYSRFGIIKLHPYPKSIMSEETTPKHEQLENVRNEKQFQNFLSEHFKDKYRTGSPIEVMRVHENVWNRLFVMHQLNDMKDSTLSFGGEVTLEIRHSLGILVLINDSYDR